MRGTWSLHSAEDEGQINPVAPDLTKHVAGCGWLEDGVPGKKIVTTSASGQSDMVGVVVQECGFGALAAVIAHRPALTSLLMAASGLGPTVGYLATMARASAISPLTMDWVAVIFRQYIAPLMAICGLALGETVFPAMIASPGRPWIYAMA